MSKLDVILPEFSHNQIDACFNLMLQDIIKRLTPTGLIAMITLVDTGMNTATVRWHGRVTNVSLTGEGKEIVNNRVPLYRNIKECGLSWLALNCEENGTTVPGLERNAEFGFYRANKPLSHEYLKSRFVNVTDPPTQESFLMPLWNLEGLGIVGIFAADSAMPGVFSSDKQDELKTLVSFVNFLGIVINCFHTAYYDDLCRKIGVFNRNYLVHILGNLL